MRRVVVVWFFALSWWGAALAEGATTVGTLAVATVQTGPTLDPTAPPSAWGEVAAVTLGWDVQHQRPSSEGATAAVVTDGRFVYVRFDVTQREQLLAAQHANDLAGGSDDEVRIDLWPGGSRGFSYQFSATPNGTHYAYSSENTGYQPAWDSYGATHDGGFTVTMKIPIGVLRGTGDDAAWKVQFVRILRSTGERQIWSYAPAQNNPDDLAFAGTLSGMHALAVAARPKPRIAAFALGEAGSRESALSTSRIGADLSLPITPTASLFATLHPDFSSVETDQQTISPTAFPRVYNEVRPFFTQAGNYFDNFDCDACPNIANLYTPNIPTPREGFAVEGRQGNASFASFDAIARGRSDAAAALTYTTPDTHWRYSMERISADCRMPQNDRCQFGAPLVHDDTFANGLSFNDGKHVDAYVDYGSDSGTQVRAGNEAQRYDTGVYLFDANEGVAFSTRKVGRYYEPADGLVQHPDIAGYAVYIAKIAPFSPRSAMNGVGASLFLDRYHNRFGALDQSDSSLVLDALTKSRLDVQVSFGATYLLQDFGCSGGDCVFAPASQNGIGLTYHSGTAMSPGNFPSHGSSSTPTSVTFNTGRFGPGRLDAWTRGTTLTAGPRGTLSFEADDTRQYLDAGGTNVQWLERLGYTYAPTANSSFALGLRRIIGTPPLLFAAAPVGCTTVETALQLAGTQRCTGAWNLSVNYHRRYAHDELYVAYGDASKLSTTPAFVFKLIHYFGADKGT